MLTDISKLSQLNAEMLSSSWARILVGLLLLEVHAASTMKTEGCFCFSPFFKKAKVLFGFLLVTENGY